MRGRAIHIGTSGWHYDQWRGPFYPRDLSPKAYLKYYIERFHTVEINNSFYRLPQKETLALWRDTVPDKFIFAVKGSRYITHMKKLKDPHETVPTFLERVEVLEDKAGPILFQLPPRWQSNPQRLGSFLEALPRRFRYAFEFRDPSWFNSEVYDSLKEHGAAFCIYELAGQVSPQEITADFVYIRLHGPGGPYQGQYTTEVLAGWARAFAAWAVQGKEVYCYFDNDEAGYATQDAMNIQEMIRGR
jgi:uncharacterized protein YecE (DUF72 family)